MDTNDLITSLSGDIKPVKPLPSFWMRFALLCGGTAVFISLGILLFADPHIATGGHIHTTGFIIENLLIIIAGLLACYAATALEVPDTYIRRRVIIPLLTGTMIWSGLIGYTCMQSGMDLWLSGAAIPEQNLQCLGHIHLLFVFPLVAVFIGLNRSAPVWRGYLGYAATLAITSFGAVGMRFFCADTLPLHLLLWHFLPVLALSVAGIFLGRLFIKHL